MNLFRSKILISILILTGCSTSPQPTITFDDTTYNIQIADTEAERQRGLMEVQSLGENEGMLFIFEDEKPRSFWMKNTYIPLDIIYMNSNFEIVEIMENIPTCKSIDTTQSKCPSYPSQNAAKYVLELNAGQVSSRNIKPSSQAILTK